MKEVESFKGTTGLGQNIKKTKILYAKHKRHQQIRKWLRKATIWPEMEITDEYLYLGILFGATVTTTNIYRAAVTKIVARAARFSPTFRRVTYAQRVLLFNVFLLSMLVYKTASSTSSAPTSSPTGQHTSTSTCTSHRSALASSLLSQTSGP